jgi:iron(III) transport system substrate-binding protein
MGKAEVYIATIFTAILIIGGIFWANQPSNEIVIYVAHDQDYSEPILRTFEEETEIKVKALYDIELTKSVGFVNKLIAEKKNPQADVFWNNEVSRTIKLKEERILEKYCSPNSIDIPYKYKDDDCYWTGFAARARVIIYNTDLVNDSEAPKSIFDLTDEKWKGKVCIANPLFGTTGTHVAALFALMGDEKAKQFFLDLKENDIQIVASNSMVRDQVVAGECLIGLTDTDDANDAIIEGKPVKMIFPDQSPANTRRSFLLYQARKYEKNNGANTLYFLLLNKVKNMSDEEVLEFLKENYKYVEDITKFPSPDEIRNLLINLSKTFEKVEEMYSFEINTRNSSFSGLDLINISEIENATDEELINSYRIFVTILPDGTLIIPNSVMMIKGAPHKDNAKKLIDYLLSKQVEKELSESKAVQMPTRKDIITPENVPKLNEIKGMFVSDEEIYNKLEISREFVQNVFIR